MTANLTPAPRWLPAAVLGLTLVALALRLRGLNSPLWFDEVATLVTSIDGSLAEIVSSFVSNNDHPLYSLLAKLSFMAFGESNWSFRLPAALAGTAAVPVLYVFAARIVPWPVALSAALMLAVSFHAVWFSQNARGYTILLLTATIATWSLVEGFQFRSRRRLALPLYALAIALASYTHLTMVLVAVGQALVVVPCILLTSARAAVARDLLLAAATFLGAAALTLVLYAPMMGDVVAFFLEGRSSAQTSAASEIASPGWAILEAFSELARHYGGVAPVVSILAFMTVGGLTLLRDRPFAAALVLVPVPVVIAATLLLGRPIFPRFFFYMGGFLLVALSLGIWVAARAATRLVGRSAPSAGLAPAMAAAVALSLGYGLWRNDGIPKQDYEGAVAFAEETYPDLAAYAVGETTGFVLNRYLGKGYGVIMDAAGYAAAADGGEAFLLHYSLVRYLAAARPDLIEAIAANCETVNVEPATVSGGEVYTAICQSGDRVVDPAIDEGIGG